MADAFNKEVGVVAGVRHHGQHATGKRIERYDRAPLITQRRHRLPLQIQIEMQAEILARHRCLLLQHPQDSPVRIGLDMLKTGLAMKQGLVAFLQPHLPSIQGASIALCIELKQILSAHSTDIAQQMAERLTVGIVAGQLCVEHDPGKLMQVHCDRRHRRIVQTQFDRHRLEGSATLAPFLKRLEFAIRQRQAVSERLDQCGGIFTALPDHANDKGRFIRGQQPPFAIHNLPTRGRNHLNPDPVSIRLGHEIVVLHNLERVITIYQHPQHNGDRQHRRDQARAIDHPLPVGVTQCIQASVHQLPRW